MKGFILLLSIAFSCFTANANDWWNLQLRDHQAIFSTSFTDTFASTMLGACRAEKIKYKHINGALIEKKRVRVELMNSGRLPAVFILQNKDGVAIKAPLMFVLPGAFTTTHSAQSVRMAKRFYEMGYHVVTFPNPWGVEFISERPYFVMGNFLKEGESLYLGMASAHEELTQKGLLKGLVSVMGISGGGYNTAMVAGLDSLSGKKILTGYATSISAPMIWSETLKHLDKLMTEVKEGLNRSLLSIAPKYIKICKRDSQDEYDEDLLQAAKLLTIKGGFHDYMIKSVELFDEINQLNSIPRKGYKTWRKNMNFGRFYKRYNPEGLALIQTKWGRIDTWVNLAKRNGYNKLRILTSVDDFLNAPDVFDELDIERERLYLIPHGGHWGMRGFGAWFDKLFYLTFDPSNNAP